MKKFKKVICLCLAVLLLMPVMIACKSEDQPQGAEETAAGTSAGASADVVPIESESNQSEKAWETDENGYVLDNLDGIDLEDKEIRILCGNSAGIDEFHVAPDKINTPLNTAVFTRNATVEKRLNCNLVWIDEPAGYGSVSFLNKVQELDVEGEVDLIGMYSLMASSLMIQGRLADMNRSTTLELDKPYWNQEMVNGNMLYDNLYFATGDISISVLHQAYMFYFNKDRVASENINAYIEGKYGCESLYELVDEGMWTIEVMIDVAKQCMLDSDGIKNQGDLFGYSAYAVGLDSFYTAAGLHQIETGADGSILISNDLTSEKAGDLWRSIIDFLKTPAAVATDTAGEGATRGLPETAWGAGEVLFFHHTLSYATNDYPFDYGVLPVPKYDTDQEKYLTIFAFPTAMWGIARNSSSDYEQICAALECLASEGYRTVTPAYFDTIVAGRQDTLEDYNMLYQIRDSIVVEAGRVMSEAFDENTWMAWRMAMRGRNEYNDHIVSYKQALADQAVALNTLAKQLETLYS